MRFLIFKEVLNVHDKLVAMHGGGFGLRDKGLLESALHQPQAKFSGKFFCKDIYETAKGSDCLVILTEWNEFKEIDFKKIKKILKQPIIVDGRNIYEPQKMKKMGFRYIGMGRS